MSNSGTKNITLVETLSILGDVKRSEVLYFLDKEDKFLSFDDISSGLNYESENDKNRIAFDLRLLSNYFIEIKGNKSNIKDNNFKISGTGKEACKILKSMDRISTKYNQ